MTLFVISRQPIEHRCFSGCGLYPAASWGVRCGPVALFVLGFGQSVERRAGVRGQGVGICCIEMVGGIKVGLGMSARSVDCGPGKYITLDS